METNQSTPTPESNYKYDLEIARWEDDGGAPPPCELDEVQPEIRKQP